MGSRLSDTTMTIRARCNVARLTAFKDGISKRYSFKDNQDGSIECLLEFLYNDVPVVRLDCLAADKDGGSPDCMMVIARGFDGDTFLHLGLDSGLSPEEIVRLGYKVSLVHYEDECLIAKIRASSYRGGI